MTRILLVVLVVFLLLPLASQAAAAPQTAGTCSASDAPNRCIVRQELWCIEVGGRPVLCWYVWVPC